MMTLNAQRKRDDLGKMENSHCEVQDKENCKETNKKHTLWSAFYKGTGYNFVNMQMYIV